MSKESKKSGLGDLIAEEVSDGGHASMPLDHTLGLGEIGNAFAGEDAEAIHPTRIIKRPKAAEHAPVATDKPIAAMPSGMRVWLELVGTTQTFSIKKSLTIIGRVREVADLVISDDELSRHHAALTFADGQFFVEDLDSTNGTFVKENRIKRVKLAPGDIVRVGSHQLKLWVEGV